MRYIHYGNKHFDLTKFKPVKNADGGSTKPASGGFWASPIDSEWGWKQWCEAEIFHVENLATWFEFELASDARVLHISNVNHLKKLKRYEWELQSILFTPDFEDAAKHWDAIELHLTEAPTLSNMESLYFQLYGWDCDSILIMNPEIVIEVNSSDSKII